MVSFAVREGGLLGAGRGGGEGGKGGQRLTSPFSRTFSSSCEGVRSRVRIEGKGEDERCTGRTIWPAGSCPCEFVSALKAPLGGINCTYCRFWMRMKERTIGEALVGCVLVLVDGEAWDLGEGEVVRRLRRYGDADIR